MGRKGLVDRRKHIRYRAKEGAFAAVRPQYVKIGQIIDISRGGLAFRYTVTDSHENESHELDIFLIGEVFHLSRVPFKIISDLRIDEKSPPSPLQMWRCGVQFGELTQNQIQELEYFIRKHTVGEA